MVETENFWSSGMEVTPFYDGEWTSDSVDSIAIITVFSL